MSARVAVICDGMERSELDGAMPGSGESFNYIGEVFGRAKLGPFFFFSSRRRHTRFDCDWSSDVCSSDLIQFNGASDPWDLIERDVGRAMESGDPLICLGGDHAITHPIMRAVRRRHRNLTILHIDAHCDIYDAYQGNRRSHASPFARIMEERLADRLIPVGIRPLNHPHSEPIP